MALSSDLISQFVQVTKQEKTDKETTVYGTIVEYDGGKFVKLDGSELLTPISTTADAIDGERVTVMIKNHSAIVTGNISSPSARTDTVKEIGNKISEFEIIIADKVSVERLEAEIARIDTLVSENVTIKGRLDANEADIDKITADNVTINEKLNAANASINELEAKKLDSEIANITYATIQNLEATQVKVDNLESTYGEFHDLTTERLDSAEANIGKLTTDKLDASEAEVKYANIDFANIDMAAVEKLFSDSGIIKDLVVSEGKITGELVGVTIKGDLIEGNTIVADKLVVKGENGLYYKLNTDGVTTEAEQTDYNSLNGTVIQAKSITAEKITVDDLVAFGATIGGFNITTDAIYSGAKSDPLNTTRGVYFDNSGQFSVGDSNNYLRYFKDSDGSYKLQISAGSIMIAASGKSVEEELNEALDKAQNAQTSANDAQATADDSQIRVGATESALKILEDSIAMLVTDANGGSLMTQTSTGWTFNISKISDSISSVSTNLGALEKKVGDANQTIDILNDAVADLGVLSSYIKIKMDNLKPCIELGTGDSDFKLLITNTDIRFMEGSSVVAYINNQSLYIEKAVIKEEFNQGGFVWKKRANGHLGLSWRGDE